MRLVAHECARSPARQDAGHRPHDARGALGSPHQRDL